MSRSSSLVACLVLLALGVSPVHAEMKQGTPDLKSAGPLAFSTDGVLFIGDPQSAAIFAVDTKDTSGDANKVELNIDRLDAKVADSLGAAADEVIINDLAVNPASGVVYLSVSRGRGPDAMPVILTVGGDGEIAEFSLENVSFAKSELPNAPEDRVVGEGRRRQNNRLESITDLLYLDGTLYVAGLSNEEFASKLRGIPFPFAETNEGASIEIFHGNHGQYETRSPVRTFTAVEIDDAPHLLAAYTCTPLVKIPVDMLKSGDKVRGVTIAELGNRNRPLDMIVYQKDGESFILMANNARGVMKIPMAGVDEAEAITEPVEEKAGVEYETLDLEGVVQLDRLNYEHAILLVQDDGGMSLKTLVLP